MGPVAIEQVAIERGPSTGPEPISPPPAAHLTADQAGRPDQAGTPSGLTAGWRAVTGRGRAVALTTVAAAVLGVSSGWWEWVGIAAGLAVLLVAAVLMALGRSSCTADLELQRTRYEVGEPGGATLLIRNTSARRMLPLQMELEIRASTEARAGWARSTPADGLRTADSDTPSGTASDDPDTGSPAGPAPDTRPTANTRTMSIPSIPGGGAHTVHIPLPTEHRAVLTLGPLRAVRGDVFGLIRRVVQWPIRREVFVRPRIARPNAALPGFVRDLEGDESTVRTSSDLSFHTLREYVPGDDRRFIHWRSSARNGTLQVREFLQTHRSLVAVVLSGNPAEYHWDGDGRFRNDRGAADGAADRGRVDAVSRIGRASRRDRGAAGDAEFELAVSCAASMVADLVGRRRAVVTDAAGTPITGATADGVIDRFCAVESHPGAPDLAFATREVLRRHPRASVVVLVFGSMTDPARLRAAFRACPPGASVLALRARVESSPTPGRLAGSDAANVLTLPDIDALPGALRIAG